MDHKFSPSITEPTLCQVCKKNLILHTPLAECEACPNIGNVEMFGDMALCSECISKEMQAARDYQKPELQEARLAEYKIVEAQRIDSLIQVRSDIFNAETVAIEDLKAAIYADDSVKNKPYRLAEILTERYNHLKNVIFELNAQQVTESNKQRAVQTALNDLANRLRQEERDKLKLNDISYRPAETVKKPKAVGKYKGKYNMADIKFHAKELGVPESVIQMICVSKGIDPTAAANLLRKTSKEVESESDKDDEKAS